MKIGVVCEGVNDFLTLKEAVAQIASAKGVAINAFDALQPRVDATSQRQVGGGGWARVKVWLEDNGGPELRKILRPQIFSASTTYDLLIIHLDGDVVWLSNDFDAMKKASCFQNSTEVVRVVEEFIEQKLAVSDELDDHIIYAVPVMHTESWLVNAAKGRPIKRNLEHDRIKDLAQRYLCIRYKCSIKEAAAFAAEELGKNLEVLRSQLPSLEHFAAKIDAAI